MCRSLGWEIAAGSAKSAPSAMALRQLIILLPSAAGAAAGGQGGELSCGVALEGSVSSPRACKEELTMVDKSLLEDPDYWRRRAEEARAIADEMDDAATKKIKVRCV